MGRPREPYKDCLRPVAAGWCVEARVPPCEQTADGALPFLLSWQPRGSTPCISPGLLELQVAGDL